MSAIEIGRRIGAPGQRSGSCAVGPAAARSIAVRFIAGRALAERSVAVHSVAVRSIAALSTVLLSSVLLGAPAPVHAAEPASVVLYGVVDLSIGRTDARNALGHTRMMSGVQSGSRFGLRGSEDLGGGTRVNFVLESGFLANDGNSAQGGRLFGRAAWVGVSGRLGEARVGRQTSVSSLTLSDFDPFLGSYLNAGAQTTLLSYNANRADNTVSYSTPTMNGWRLSTDYSFDYDSRGATTSESSNLASAAVVYSNNGVSFAGTFETVDWGQGSPQQAAMRAAGGDRQPYVATLAGRWDLQPATLYGAVALMRHGSTIPAVPSPGQLTYFPGSSVKAAMLGATWRIGTGSILGSWQVSLPDNSGTLKQDNATHNQMVFSGGYSHDLSKRTNLYGIVAYLDGAWNDASRHEVQYAVGMRHRF